MEHLIIRFASVQLGFEAVARALFVAQPFVSDGRKPNVLLLAADGLGFRSLGMNGCTIAHSAS